MTFPLDRLSELRVHVLGDKSTRIRLTCGDSHLLLDFFAWSWISESRKETVDSSQVDFAETWLEIFWRVVTDRRETTGERDVGGFREVEEGWVNLFVLIRSKGRSNPDEHIYVSLGECIL